MLNEAEAISITHAQGIHVKTLAAFLLLSSALRHDKQLTLAVIICIANLSWFSSYLTNCLMRWVIMDAVLFFTEGRLLECLASGSSAGP